MYPCNSQEGMAQIRILRILPQIFANTYRNEMGTYCASKQCLTRVGGRKGGGGGGEGIIIIIFRLQSRQLQASSPLQKSWAIDVNCPWPSMSSLSPKSCCIYVWETRFVAFQVFSYHVLGYRVHRLYTVTSCICRAKNSLIVCQISLVRVKISFFFFFCSKWGLKKWIMLQLRT